MKRLRVAAGIVALLVVWLVYWGATELANQRQRRAAAGPVHQQALVEPGSTGGTVVYRSRTQAPDASPEAAAVKLPKFSSARALAVAPHASAHVPESVQASAAITKDLEPLPEAPKDVPALQSALSEAHGGVPGAQGRRGAIGGAAIPPMWGVGSGGASRAHAPINDGTYSGDERARVLGHAFAADSGDSAGTAGSNTSGGSNGGNGSNGSNGSSGSNDQSGTQNAGTGSGGNTGGGSSPAGGSTQGGGSGQQGTGGGAGGGNNGSNAGGGTEGGAVNTLGANGVTDDGATAEVVVDVPEPGSILLGLGLAAAFLRRRAR